ncbi:MAG: hypothetical protein LAN64_18150 [Acidobacteriia bacterium]|nr:hypothetical protein [Terriglobia bacterium]
MIPSAALQPPTKSGTLSTVPFETINRLSQQMIEIIGLIQPLDEYKVINKRDKKEVEETKARVKK